jgi:hypothetical protein
MKRKPPLLLEEHRMIGIALARINRRLVGADTLNEFRRQRPIMRKLMKAAREIDKLRSKLDSLLFDKLAGRGATAAIYYGHQSSNVMPWSAVREELEAVRNIINGRIPARIMDLYLRCDHSMWSAIDEMKYVAFQKLKFVPQQTENGLS